MYRNLFRVSADANAWRRRRRVGLATLLFAAAMVWLTSHGEPLQPGQVERVVDGDTLRVIDGEGQPRTLRLLAIDAPESGQAGGEVARDFVAARVCGSSAVEWQSHGQDRYGRTVASVSIDGEDLAVALLRAGLVWRVRKYLDGQPAELQSAYENAWRQARESRIGLWAGDPEPPWAWRQHSRPERGHGIDCSAYRGSLH